MRSRPYMFLVAGVGLAVAGSVGIALAFGADSGSDSSAPVRQSAAPTPVAYTDGRLAPTAGAALTPEGALRKAVAMLRSRRIVAARLGERPAWAERVATPGPWVYMTVRADAAHGPLTIRPIWEADLAVGAARDDVAVNGTGTIENASYALALPDGTVLAEAGGGMGNVVAGQRFSAENAARVRPEIAERVATADLRLVELDIRSGMQLAPAVVATTSDPAGFVRRAAETVTAIFGAPGAYEGVYLEVRDTAGSPVFVEAASFRTGHGQRWIRPDLDERTGAVLRTPGDPSDG